MNKTVFITGIAGLMGSNLAKHFLTKGYTVAGCDNLIGGYENNIPKKEVEFWTKTDIMDIESLKEDIKGFDIVLHCASLPYEGLSVFSPKLVTESIFTGTVSVASACIANNVELLLNCSSMARYGDVQAPFKESMICNPVDPYGLAKFQAEQQLNLLSDIHGLKVNHVVPHNIVGPGQRYTDPFRNVASIMANRLLQGKSIVIYGDGSQTRSFSDIRDCVSAIYNLVTGDFDNKDIFNIGPDNNAISVKELGTIVARSLEIYPEFDYYPDRPNEVKHAHCSSAKARNKLGYTQKISTEDTIKFLATWVKNQGAKPFDYHLPLEFVTDLTPKTWTEKLI